MEPIRYSPKETADLLGIAPRALGLALKKDGTVVAWGVMDGKPAVVPEGLSNVVAIAAGHNFCLAIATNNPALLTAEMQK